MRWQFPEFQTLAEIEERRSVLNQIDAWWAEFTRQADRIARHYEPCVGSPFDLPGFMSEHLHAVHPGLVWEFGPALRGPGLRLVLTCANRRDLRPLTDTLVARAPDLTGWEFYGYRLAETVKHAEVTLRGRAQGTLDGLKIRVTGGAHQQIDLTFLHHDFAGPDDYEAIDTAFVAAEALLGEQTLNEWINAIETDRLSPRKLFRHGTKIRGLVTPDRLKPTIEAMVDARTSQLFAAPVKAWGLYRDIAPDNTEAVAHPVLGRDRPARDDYPGRHNVLAALTPWGDGQNAAASPRSFCSARFSRHQETFCYLKTDRRAGFTSVLWEDRETLELALDEILMQTDTGGVCGGGNGGVYSYVAFALTDLHRGLEAIRRVLQEGDIHPRSWILFHDETFKAEWVGAYDDTPAPPRKMMS